MVEWFNILSMSNYIITFKSGRVINITSIEYKEIKEVLSNTMSAVSNKMITLQTGVFSPYLSINITEIESIQFNSNAKKELEEDLLNK